MPSLTQQLLLVLDPPKREGRFLLPGNDRRPADISVPHWSNGKDAARRGEAKGGGGEEAGGRREAAYQDVREGRERYDRRSQDRLDTVGEREDERRKRRDEEERRRRKEEEDRVARAEEERKRRKSSDRR